MTETGKVSPGLTASALLLEGRAGQDAFSFVADVEEDLVGGEGDDDALKLALAGLALVRVAALEGGEQVGEGFLRLGRLGRLVDWELGDRLGGWLRLLFRGGLRFFEVVVVVGHDGLLIHCPMNRGSGGLGVWFANKIGELAPLRGVC